MPLSSPFTSTTLTHAGSPYFLSAIPVALVRAFTTESASDKDRDTVASQVLNLYGATGLLALWFFQGHQNEQWRLCKDMGLSLEDTYRLESGAKEIMAVPLPEGIVPGHS